MDIHYCELVFIKTLKKKKKKKKKSVELHIAVSLFFVIKLIRKNKLYAMCNSSFNIKYWN